ncbi:MAG TPA: hypothetical protein VF258_03065, partial [Luteolibacter sp.]
FDWSFRLAAPVFQPLVRRVVHLLSENRLTLSRLMKVRDDAQLARSIRSLTSPKCGSRPPEGGTTGEDHICAI